jgi:hypothetical protein
MRKSKAKAMPTFTAVFCWCRVGVPVCAAELSAAVLNDVAVEVCISVEEGADGVSVESEDPLVCDEIVGVGDAMVEIDVWRNRVSKDRTDSDSI